MKEMPTVLDDATLLLVDENPINIRLLHQALKTVGHVHFATSGQRALALMERIPVDLVLLDINMPGMRGHEVCREIMKKWPEIKVIFVTSHHDAGSEVDALSAGGIDFIHKPFNPVTIKARVKAHLEAKKQSDLIRNLLHLDPLTHINNRRGLDAEILKQWPLCQQAHLPLCLLMIDIDYFKRYNDFYGHIEGDRCLQLVAQTIKDSIRKSGYPARFGGEEFAVLLPGLDALNGQTIAQRLLENVRHLNEPHAKSEAAPYVSVSIGVASIFPPPMPEDTLTHSNPGLTLAASLFSLADKALYQAKLLGRNQAASMPHE